MSAVTIRDAEWPRDEAAALALIDGLQRYEHAFEPNRRIDAAVAAEYRDVLMKAVAEKGGIVRVAEADGGVGYVPMENLIGRAEIVMGSVDFLNANSLLQWPAEFRVARVLKRVR